MNRAPGRLVLAFLPVLLLSHNAWGGAALPPAPITYDGSLGPPSRPAGTPAVQLFPNAFVIGQNDGSGTQYAPNLFHSFQDFGLNAGQIAVFTAQPNTFSRVISRVTGGNASVINGQIRGLLNQSGFAALPGVDFYFANPSGVVFGPQGSVNVTGAFHVTSADSVDFTDAKTFLSNPGLGVSTLSSAPVQAFGFVNAKPASISVSGGANALSPSGNSLSFVGGDLTLGRADGSAPARLSTTGGAINLISVASKGRALADGSGYNVDGFPTLGNVNVYGGNNSTTLSATNGAISVKAQNLNLGNASAGAAANVLALGGTVAFDARGTVNLIGHSFVDGRSVSLNAKDLNIQDSLVFPGFFASQGLSAVASDNLSVVVSNDLSMTGSGATVFGQTPGLRVRGGSSTAISTLPAAALNVSVGGKAALSGSTVIRSERFGPGQAGDVTLSASRLELRNGASIAVSNFYAGKGGDLTVKANDVLISRDGSSRFTGLTTQSDFHPIYATDTLAQTCCSAFKLDTFDKLRATALVPANANFFQARDIVAGINLNTTINAAGLTSADGGTLRVEVQNTLEMRSGAEVNSDSFAFGRAGDVHIKAGNASFSRDGATSGAIASQSALAGRSGNITVDVNGNLDMSGGFRISATTSGAGDGGAVDVKAGQAIRFSALNTGVFGSSITPTQAELDGFAQRFAVADFAALRTQLGLAANADLFAVLAALNTQGVTAVTDLSPGNAGQINLSAPQIALSDGARIDSSTVTDGAGGLIRAQTGTLSLAGGAQIRSQSGLRLLGTGAIVAGKGKGGKIELSATEAITLTGDGSSVSSSTLGDGEGGDLFLTAKTLAIGKGARLTAESANTAGKGSGGTITVDVKGTITIDGNGSSVSTSTLGDGDGGNIAIRAGDLVMHDGASLSAASTGLGRAGNINVDTTNRITLSDSSITTQATVADGGDITLNTVDRLYLQNSAVTTAVQSGEGGGGNINVDPRFVVLQDSQIIANAFGGPGGNIKIVAGQFVVDPQSIIEASSRRSIDGVIEIDAPDTDVSATIAVLPESLLDATALLRQSCGAARTGAASSLAARGKGGIPVDPDGYLPSHGTSYVRADRLANIRGPATPGIEERLHAQTALTDALLKSKLDCSSGS